MDYLILFNNTLIAAKQEPWLRTILAMDPMKFGAFLGKIGLAVVFLISLIYTQPINRGQVVAVENPQINLQTVTVDAKQLDERAQILAAYFKSKNSPLENHAQDFIDAADKFQMDWRLVPAIAGVESGFGKRIPGGHGPQISYNAWGWGVYGTQSLGFKSWRDGIFTVSGGLKTRYIDRGLTDPYAMNKVYAASPTWGAKVTHFLADIEKFTKTYQSVKKTDLNTSTQVAGTSAQIASK